MAPLLIDEATDIQPGARDSAEAVRLRVFVIWITGENSGCR